MYQIDNETFGAFIMMLRKEQQLTQKELADKLYVSDKATSKWERGLSMLNITLLIPLSEVLNVTVTELLRGHRLNENDSVDNMQAELLLIQSIDISRREQLKQQRKQWQFYYIVCVLLSLLELILLYFMKVSWIYIMDSVLLIVMLTILFGGWFCFRVSDILPSYYDNHNINFYSTGIFRMNIAGLAFNNRNWVAICNTVRTWCLLCMVLVPLMAIIVITYFGISIGRTVSIVMTLIFLFGMFISVYYVGKKYS